MQPVFNLQVDGDPEFFAGDVLSHNCDSWIYLHRMSAPSRMATPGEDPVLPGTPEHVARIEARMLQDAEDAESSDPRDIVNRLLGYDR